MPSAADQRTRATQAVKLVLEHADIDDARDLLMSLHLMLDAHAETHSHGPVGC